MSTHIRRDGGWLCGHDLHKGIFKRGYEPHISFTDAHKRANMNGVCEDCQKEYYRRIAKLDIIVDHSPEPKKRIKDSRVIQISDELSTGQENTRETSEEPKEETEEYKHSEAMLKKLRMINRIIRGY